MVRPEDAQKELEARQVPLDQREARQTARVRALPEALRWVAFAITNRDAEGKGFFDFNNQAEAYRRREENRKAAAAALDALSPAEREQVFGALLPGLGRELALHWSADRGLYQSGYARRAFRAPGRPDLTRDHRFEPLTALVGQLASYQEQDILWLATWAGYLGWVATALGPLFASVIDAGGETGERVFDILLASAKGEHEVGAMGRHVTRALLGASRPDGWEFVEKLLLAGQRQEGLRQEILENADEAHPEAFRRLLRLIAEHDLMRFSATIRALDVWFALGWDVPTLKQANAALSRASDFVLDPSRREEALATSDDGETVYLALWAAAFEDALAAGERAKALLADPLAVRRAAAIHLLRHLGLPECREALVPALDDDDLRLSAMAFEGLGIHYSSYWVRSGNRPDEPLAATDVFERLERNLARYPKEVAAGTTEPILFPWLTPAVSRDRLGEAMVATLGDRHPERLLPHLPQFSPDARAGVAGLFGQLPPGDDTRGVLLGLVTDASSTVRDAAITGLGRHAPDHPEIVAQYEKLLTRKSADLRTTLLGLLLKQDDAGALASADRLLAAKAQEQRVAGLGLLDEMAKAGRQPEAVRERAKAFAARRSDPTQVEKALLERLLDADAEKPTLDNALGLMDPANLTPPVPPAPPTAPPTLVSPSSLAIVQGLAAWLEERRQVPVSLVQWDDSRMEMLLGDVTGYQLPQPSYSRPLEEDRARLPLVDELEAFWRARPAAMRDADGMELVRLDAAFRERMAAAWGDTRPRALRRLSRELFDTESRFPTEKADVLQRLFAWLQRLDPGAPAARAADFLLDAAAHSLAKIAEAEREALAEKARLAPTADAASDGEDAEEDDDEDFDLDELLDDIDGDDVNPADPALDEAAEQKLLRAYTPGSWRATTQSRVWLVLAEEHHKRHADAWTPEQWRRLWDLLLWQSKPHPEAERQRVELDALLLAFRAGYVNADDVYDHLLGPRPTEGYWRRQDFSALQALCTRKEDPRLSATPGLWEIVDACRRRVLEVEAGRGDNPTLVTQIARSLPHTGGMAVLLRFLKLLGKDGLSRVPPSYRASDDRASVFSAILRATHPGPDETPEVFAAQAAAEKLPEKLLVEAAVFAPQWARHVEAALGWPSFAEGVWWLHAHTKDPHYFVEDDLKSGWAAEIADKTPLTADDLMEGGVDVAWFHRIHAALGEARWLPIDAAAKFASSSVGHKRAQLYADAMLGRIAKEDVARRVRDKRHQDSVRALGLLPLPADPEARESETLDRYATVQEFLRTSKQFGAQRQENEKRAARLALENLARTVGYPDPVRLEWAMEKRAVADLAGGPVTAEADGVTVQLSINPLGEPDLRVLKNGKALANIPPKAKKAPEVAALLARRKEIERQASRMRLSLEEAMIRGDVFTAAELAGLLEHPVLRPLLRSLVFIEASEGGEPVLGYPADDAAQALEDAAGTVSPLRPDLPLRVAHPLDLLHTGHWDRWQRDCFLRERVQPFKQVFRELYVLTEQEKTDGTFSRRYSGHQVNPKQALALLGKRGWISSYDEAARKTFHAAGISAYLDSTGTTFSPLDVEGFTIENVCFVRRGEYTRLPLTEVPPRLFSEAMRDLDLVVSVAHVGGVDPEASASTVEMRAALVREAASLLKLENVRVEKSHVLIAGHLADYSIHLGSAIVHRQPGGFVCIVPSFAPQRGRLFLPFADNDPRTAEVVSKVLLLAKDREIKDPTILEQLLAVR